MMPSPLRTRARGLLEEMNDFSTASAALQWLFEDVDHEKLSIVELILHWQNRSSQDPLEAVLTDYQALEEDLRPEIHRDMLLLVMGKPALLFAASIYDEELATIVWRGLQQIHSVHQQFNLLLQVMDNTRDSHGLSSLHYAIEAQMTEFFCDVSQQLARMESEGFRRSIVEVRSQDVVLPMAAKQVTGKSISSGGCTLLHLAARKGELEIVTALLRQPVALVADDVGGDWDGLTPLQLAALHRRSEIHSILQLSSLENIPDESLKSMQVERDARATRRYMDSMVAREPMARREVFRAIWSHEECEQVMRELKRATDLRGWSKQRHTSYPTTDLPCYQVASIDGWVRSAIQTRLFTQVYERYSIPLAKMLTFRELFYVKYEAREGEQAELPLHCDGSVLSFNILLNPKIEFSGGGTFFEEANVTIQIEQGDAVVHSGKVRHAGAAVTRGRRTILVGFLDLVDRVAL